MLLARFTSPLLLLVLVAACSPVSSGTDSVLTRLSSAAEASEEAGTVRIVATTVTEYDDPDLDEVVQEIEGEFDFDRGILGLTADLEELDSSIRIILFEDTVYLSSSFLGSLGLDDTEPQWVSFDAEVLWEDTDLLALPVAMDPEGFFDSLKSDGADVTEVGPDEIDGQAVTRYSIVHGSEAIEELYPDDVVDSFATDVWIDDRGLVRRLTESTTKDWFGLVTKTTTTIDFLDYGLPVGVEIPDPSTVIDPEEFFEESLGDDLTWPEDVFDGADCYGEALAECLLPNQELADLYGDPAECTGSPPRVCLVPVGFVRRDVVEAILEFHRDTAGIEIVVLPAIPIDPATVDFDASQGLANSIFDDVKEAYGLVGDEATTYIGLTSIDLRPDDGEYGWYFGHRTGWDGFGHVHGFFSYFRMGVVAPYDGSPLDDELLFERAAKYMGRYVALLHLKHPFGDDYNYMNYEWIYGFSDLDSMQPNWPEGVPPCLGEGAVICIVPDRMYFNDVFEEDLEAILDELSAATGLPVEMHRHGGAFPTYDPWSDEYRDDLWHYVSRLIEDPDVLVIGVTDDPFADGWDLDEAENPHITKAWQEEGLAVASGFNAGEPGTAEHQERLYRLLLRAILLAQGDDESTDPESILFSGHTEPADLDGVMLPE